ncbi:MAG: site-specific integrase [Oligoflexia bacterium]|nr:site-specific integrase [Oligoflexia bacterium]
MDLYFEKLKKELDLRGFSHSSKKSYIMAIKKFLQFVSKPSEDLDENDLKNFQYYLLKIRNLNPKTINLHTSAILFFYQKALNKYIIPQLITRMKCQKKIPTVLTTDEVQRMLSVTNNLKYKTIIMTLYSAGLRVSEVIHLKVTDIDSARMVIMIRNGKGGKDRQAILSPILLEQLRKYWIFNRKKIKGWLFPSSVSACDLDITDPPMSSGGISKIVVRAAKEANIKKQVSPHTLRHYAEFLVMPRNGWSPSTRKRN